MSWITKLFPFLLWIKDLSNPKTLKADILAGLTVGFVIVPQSMAYAQLAGLGPQYGLYAAFLPVLVGAVMGSSRQLSTGPVAVVSLLTGGICAKLTPSVKLTIMLFEIKSPSNVEFPLFLIPG